MAVTLMTPIKKERGFWGWLTSFFWDSGPCTTTITYGSTTFKILDVEPYVALDRQSEVTPLKLEIGAEPKDRTRAEHEAFLAAIRGEREPLVSWREAMAVQRILSAIYESAERGEEVRP